MDVLTDNVGKLIEEGANRAIGADQAQMSTEEFISWSCNMQKVLDMEFRLLEKKRRIAIDKYKEIDAAC